MTDKDFESLKGLKNKLDALRDKEFNTRIPTTASCSNCRVDVKFEWWDVSRKNISTQSITISEKELKRLFFEQRTRILSELHKVKHEFDSLKITNNI
jgi:hypothetical protein